MNIYNIPINMSRIAQEILAQTKGLPFVKCELCEEVKNIHLHHIDRNKNNNKIPNLILLCKECHQKAHKEDIKKVSILEDKEKINKFIKDKVNKIIEFRKKDIQELKSRLAQEKRLKKYG